MTLENKIYFLKLNSQNSLKRALSILKHSGNPILKASYSSGLNSIHKHLSVKENIEIDILNRVFSKSEMSIENMQERLRRLKLYDYYQLLGITNILHTQMSKLNVEQITLYSHFKALTRGHDVIIFDSPSKNLQNVSLENFKTCLKSCALTRPVIICSQNPMTFNDLIDFYIDDTNQKVKIKENKLKVKEHSTQSPIIIPISA